jgi:hypothetical protein
MKQCTVCQKWLHFEAFRPQGRSLSARCRNCIAERAKQVRKAKDKGGVIDGTYQWSSR